MAAPAASVSSPADDQRSGGIDRAPAGSAGSSRSQSNRSSLELRRAGQSSHRSRRRSCGRRRRARPGRRPGCRERSARRSSRAPLGEHPLPLVALAAVVGGGGGVDDQLGRPPRPPLMPAGPGTQMSSQIVSPTADPVELDQPGLGPGLEVAALVEDPVVRQPILAVDADDLAVREQRQRVVGAAAGRRASARRGEPTRATIPSAADASCSSAATAGVEEVALELAGPRRG